MLQADSRSRLAILKNLLGSRFEPMTHALSRRDFGWSVG